MHKILQRLVASMALLAITFSVSSPAVAGTRYVVTNDDSAFPFPTGVSFYSIGADGQLTLHQWVRTGTFGIAGGFFGANRIAVLNSDQQCVFASEAANGNIVGIDVNTLAVGGIVTGSDTDGGTSNGIGLAMSNKYLYASFTDSNTIGTFQVQGGCSLTFIDDTPVAGLQQGTINGMAIHGNMLIATYTDGTVNSFDISDGTPQPNHDKQFTAGHRRSHGATYANAIDITQDGHFAIFGDTSTLMEVEVADISSGRVTRPVPYQSRAGISSSNITLSADESILYVVNTQGDRISALFFNKSTGALTPGCTSGALRGVSENFSYLGGVVPMSESGNGGGVYVTEFGTGPGIAEVKLTVSGGTCTLQETAKSPVAAQQSPGLLSIGNFPPRSF